MNFIEDQTAEKLRGGYYTPPDIAKYLARWVAGTSPRVVLEPTCGDGAFLRALSAMSAPGSVLAFEIDGDEAKKSRHELRPGGGTVVEGDFLAWALERLGEQPSVDGVLGNPPFIRYQYLTDTMQARAERLIRHFSLRFTKHTNAWVPIVVGALANLRPGGRLAMVVPAEILHVLHAESIRTYLLRECSRILVLDPEELWFKDTLQGVVLLMAEKKDAGDTRRVLGRLAITRIRGREFLDGDPEAHFVSASYVDGDTLPAKWMAALLSGSEREAIATASSHAAVQTFARIASVAVGIVTGANKFFLVPDETIRDYDLDAYAHPMFGRSEHVAGVVYDRQSHEQNKLKGYPTNFLWFDDAPREQLQNGALRYVELGERQDLHKRFKCRIRQPWYRVPSVFTAPVGMLKRCHDYPRLVLNEANAYTTDTAYRIVPKRGDAGALVTCFVNSLTALTAELEGRHYGGGVLELVPSEINRLLVPVVDVDRAALLRLDAACRKGVAPEDLFEMQDRVVLAPLGLSLAQREDIENAWWKLRNRRHRSGFEESEPIPCGAPLDADEAGEAVI